MAIKVPPAAAAKKQSETRNEGIFAAQMRAIEAQVEREILTAIENGKDSIHPEPEIGGDVEALEQVVSELRILGYRVTTNWNGITGVTW